MSPMTQKKMLLATLIVGVCRGRLARQCGRTACFVRPLRANLSGRDHAAARPTDSSTEDQTRAHCKAEINTTDDWSIDVSSTGVDDRAAPRAAGVWATLGLQKGTAGGPSWADVGVGGRVLERMGSIDVEIRLSEDFTPLERVAISADGNLQRIVSSYYNAQVTVTIKRCEEVSPGVFDREVDLSVFGEVFCTATSSLVAKTPECAVLLREKSLGLGQLFRRLKTHPDFRLLDADKTTDGFWRVYDLDCPDVWCRILEQFTPDTFTRQGPPPLPIMQPE